MSNEQVQWLMKILQPEKTLGSLPGNAALTESIRAALIGVDPKVYSSELSSMRKNAKSAADELLADPAVAELVDRLPLKKNAQIVAFGDSLTADPQSWAAIIAEILIKHRPHDELSVIISAVPADTTTHGLVRLGEALARQPDWLLFFIGVNDARTQGPKPTKTMVGSEETARNLAEMHNRAVNETKARRLWIAPPAVIEDKVSAHWGLSRFGVRFRNEDVAQVARHMKGLGDPVIDLFSILGSTPSPGLLMGDGLHLTLAGQKQVALEVLRGWSSLEP